MSIKNPLTPAGIEPATFRFVAQHLNHCATAVPHKKQEPTDINVLQWRVLTNILKIFKVQKDEINIGLNVVTALQTSKQGYILHFIARPV